MSVLAVAMQKGGVGKTTTTLSLGVDLAQRGRRVLLVDMDAQSNLTQAAGLDPSQISRSVFDVLTNPRLPLTDVLVSTEAGVDLLPATFNLARAELVLAGHVGRELLLQRAVQAVRNHYDYILIDAPPSLGLLTLNALAAADAVIVPLQAHVFALQSLVHLEETIDLVQQLNPALQIGGIVLTMVDKRTSVNAAVEQAAREQYGDLMFATTIPFNVKLVEAPAVGQPIAHYAPNSTSAQAYRELAEEVEARYGQA